MIPIYINEESRSLIEEHYTSIGLSKPSKNDLGEFIDYLVEKHLF